MATSKNSVFSKILFNLDVINSCDKSKYIFALVQDGKKYSLVSYLKDSLNSDYSSIAPFYSSWSDVPYSGDASTGRCPRCVRFSQSSSNISSYLDGVLDILVCLDVLMC